MQTAFISHPACHKHNAGADHPENNCRLDAIQDYLILHGLFELLDLHDAPRISQKQLLKVHPSDYLDNLHQQLPSCGHHPIDSDTVISPESLDAALHAAGAGILAVDLVMQQKASNAFCCIRPPGHHAGRQQAMGFCLLNNIALAASHALSQYQLQRIAIIDFDAHHGNGTEEIFADNAQVMLCSLFQHPFYPFTGTDKVRDGIINIPLAAYSTGRQLREAALEHWLPALRRFQPELLLLSAGFDGHQDDDMTQLLFNHHDYIWLTREIKQLARQSAAGRIVSILEGGYDLDALALSAGEHIRGLME